MIKTKVHHVALFVSRMERARYLFENILDFRLIWHAPMVKGSRMSALLGIPDVQMEIAYLEYKPFHTALELCRMIHPPGKEARSFGNPGSVSLSLQVENLDGLHDRLTREGWRPFSPCMDMRNPEGHLVRLFCFPMEEGIAVELIQMPSVPNESQS